MFARGFRLRGRAAVMMMMRSLRWFASLSELNEMIMGFFSETEIFGTFRFFLRSTIDLIGVALEGDAVIALFDL